MITSPKKCYCADRKGYDPNKPRSTTNCELMSKQQTKMTWERFRDTLFFQGVYRTSSKNFEVVSTEDEELYIRQVLVSQEKRRDPLFPD